MHFPAQDGETALHVATWCGHLEVCRVLIEAKASVNAVTEVGRYGDCEIYGLFSQCFPSVVQCVACLYHLE